MIGLRSIGTSLSAVVAATLQQSGIEVLPRVTVRPTGHPFARKVECLVVRPAAKAFIIVDEGPVLSGSSMVSVAEVLRQHGEMSLAVHYETRLKKALATLQALA